MIDFADLIAINKADRRGALDALRDVRKQYRRSRKLFQEPKDEELPVYLTKASQFNDSGLHSLFFAICHSLMAKNKKFEVLGDYKKHLRYATPQIVIPTERGN